MGAWLQPSVLEDRFARVGAQADHVGTADRVFDALDRARARPTRGQALRVLGRAGGHPQLPEAPYLRQHLEVGGALDAGADDGQHGRLLAGEQPRREARRRRGPVGGDVGPVHDAHRRAGVRVEKRDQSLMRGQATVVVARKDRDQLDRDPHPRDVARHGAQEAQVGHLGRDPRRHRDLAPCERLESLGQRVQQRFQAEQPLHLGGVEAEDLRHGREFSVIPSIGISGFRPSIRSATIRLEPQAIVKPMWPWPLLK